MSQTAVAKDLFPKSYKSSTNSQIPGSFSPALHRAWESEAYQNLNAEHQALYDKMSFFLKWNQKQRVKSGNSYISGWTRRITAKEIQEKFFKNYTEQTINKWLKVLCASGLLVQKFTQGKIRQFLITHWQSPNAIATWEENATKREIAIAEVAQEKVVIKTDFTNSASQGKSDLSTGTGLLFKEEIKELSSSPGNIRAVAETLDAPPSSSNAATDQEHQIYRIWLKRHKNKYISRGAFLKHLRKFEKVCQEWRDLEAEAAQRLLMSAIPKMPTHDKDGKSIGSPVWLIKDDRNYGILQDGLKAEGVDIGHDVSEVVLVSQVDTKTGNDAQVATKKFEQERLTPQNSTGFDGGRSTKRSIREDRKETASLIEEMKQWKRSRK